MPAPSPKPLAQASEAPDDTRRGRKRKSQAGEKRTRNIDNQKRFWASSTLRPGTGGTGGLRAPTTIRLTVSSCGEELATLDADGTWRLVDVLAALPERFRSDHCVVRVFCGTQELDRSGTLSDVGAGSGAALTVVRSPALRVLTASTDGSAVRVWSVASGECLLNLTGLCVDPPKVCSLSAGGCWPYYNDHGSHMCSAVFSPDGERVLTAPHGMTAKVWSAASGECLQTLTGHEKFVWSAVFSPDGERVLTVSDDNSLKVWFAASGECLQTLTGHEKYVCSAVFSSDGERVLTASCDDSARVWSAASGECLHTFRVPVGRVLSPVFFPSQKGFDPRTPPR